MHPRQLVILAAAFVLSACGGGGGGSDDSGVVETPTIPAPTLSLSANPTTVASGAGSTLTWSSTDASSCTASGAWSGSQGVSGSKAVTPPTAAGDYSYTLACTGAGGSVSKNAVVTVTAPPPAPTLTFSANPTTVASGGSSTLTWNSTDASSCTASGAWSGSQSVSGSKTVTAPTAAGDYTYTVACTGAGGSVSKNAVVTVTAPPPAPTLSLSANPTTVASGGSSTLSWNSANTTSCTASGAWSGSQGVSGSKAVTLPTAAGDYSYTLACTGAGGSTSKNAVVTVAPAPTLSLSANPTTVAAGNTSTLTWSSTGTSSCNASGAWSGSQSVNGSKAVAAPTVPGDHTYTLACTGAGGSVSKNAIVTVAPMPTLSLGANPTTVASGGSSTLSWNSTNTTSCTASGAWSGSQGVSGSKVVTLPTTAGDYSYTLACTGAGGSVSKNAVVTVAPAPTLSLSANPTTVAAGNTSTLTWSSTGASSCTASGAWSGSQSVNGSKAVAAPTVPGDYTYTLACTGVGGSVSKNAVVTVAPMPTLSLGANPTAVAAGASSTLTWNSTNTTSCTASGAWSGIEAVSGSKAVAAPTVPGDYTYTLACTGAGGSVSKSAVVTVAPMPALTLSANPASVTAGASSTLTWNSTNASSCTASGAWTGSQGINGSKAVTPPTTVGNYSYTLACTGTGGSVSKSAVVAVTAAAAVDPNSCYDPANPSNKPSTDRVDAAVKSGDPSGLQSAQDRPTLLQCATRKATALRARPQQVLADIYGNVDLSINIGYYTTSIKSTGLSGAIPYIVSDKGTGIAAIVELAGDTKTGRGMAYGADVLNWMSGTSKEQQHLPLFTRAFTWLMTGSASGTLPTTIKFSQTAYSANSVKNFVARVPGKTATEVVCDITDPANTCWQGLDLLVFGESVKDKGGLEDLVRSYLKAGKSVIYMHSDWNISTGAVALLSGMGMMSANSAPGDGPGNYFESQDGYSVASGRTAADSLAHADQASKLITALDLLQQPSYSKDFATDTAPVDGINLVLNEISGLEGRGKKLFAVENTTLYRLLVLWADEMRPDITYGSAQLNRTNYPADFLRAYASDSWLAYNRSRTTTNPNGQGDYMLQAAQSLAVSTADETLVLTLPQGSGKTAIGRGAIPAKAVAITVVGVRNQDGTAATGVNLGLQTSYIRARGNPLKDNNNYARPRQPNSWSVSLQSGVVNDFISPAGGPLFLNYSGATAGQQVTLKIRGVVRYAHFDFANGTPPQAELDAAMAALQRQDYGWATFKFRGGELQQTIATALNSFKFGMPAGQLRTPQDLVTRRIEGILMDTNHLANGYNDMTMSPKVSALCAAFGWDCTGSMHNPPGVQHFVSWLAACGSGCSGQPIDSNNWTMDIGWGWPHELGHNTVQNWMHVVIDGKGCSTECDNNTLSSAHMLRRYAVLGEDASGDNTGHPALYKMIQENRATLMSGEPQRADMQARLWGGPEQRPMLAMYFQLAFLYTQARHGLAQPTADTTIEFLTLLSKGGHLIQKNWSAATAASYGMSRYTSNSIPNHELLYVLASRIIGQDLRNVFFMYGVPLSQTALDSVADLGGNLAPLQFYALGSGKANQLATGQWLSLQGQTPAYPF